MGMRVALRCAVLLALLAPLAGRGEDGGPSAAGPHVLQIRVGASVAICKTGTILCPAGAATCDDPAVAVAQFTEEGVAFKGLKPGATLCSARAASGQGRSTLYRVVVDQ